MTCDVRSKIGPLVGVAIALAIPAGVRAAATSLSPSEPTIAIAVSPIYQVAIPNGYREWPLIAPSQETGALDELRGIVGNTVAIRAYRAGTLPFPDGTVLVKLAYQRVHSIESPPAFVPGAPTTVQVMVKDSKRYASTGGWGFGRFVAGQPVDEAQHRTCFACHQALVNGHDYVFTRWAP